MAKQSGIGLDADKILDSDEVTAKGQIFVGSASGQHGLLSVGSDGEVLTADSAEPLGVKWASAGGGGGGDVTGPASSVDTQVPVFSGTTGKVIAASLAKIGSTGILNVPSSSSTTPDSGVFVDGGTGTGIFSSTAGVLTLRANNNNTFTMTSTTGLSAGNTGGASMRSSSSSAANPAHTFTGNLTSGLYSQSGLTGISAFGVAALNANSSQKVAIGTATATASLHIQKVGTAAANTAPFKIDPGVLMTVAESGAIENDGTSLYYTDSTGTRTALGSGGGGGGGDVVGPASSLDGQLAIYDGTTGKLLKASTNVVNSSDQLGLGITPTATLHLKAGTTAANTAPIKIATGSLLTSPESGAIEWDGSALWTTNSALLRRKVGNISGPNSTTANYVPKFSTTDGSTVVQSLMQIDVNGATTIPTGYGNGLLVGSTRLSEAITGNLVVTCNGTISARFGPSSIFSSNAYSMAISSLTAGSAAAPTYSFASDATSGLWSNASGLYLSKGGTNGLSMDTSRNITLAAGLATSGYQTQGFTVPGAYPYTVLATDITIHVNTTTARTINLPSTTLSGRIVTIKDVTGSAGTNAITISAGGTVLIDGATSYQIASNYGSAQFQWNGTKWVVISASAASGGGTSTAGLVKISSVTASSSASIIFTDLTTYSNYKIIFDDVAGPNTNNDGVNITFSTDNGATWLSSGYAVCGLNNASTPGSGPYIGTGININGSATTNNSFGQIDFFQLKSTTSYKYCTFFGSGIQSSGFWKTPNVLYGINTTTSVVNAIKLSTFGTTFSSGNFTLYGFA